MGVAKRTGVPPIYYLYHLHRADMLKHAKACPNRVMRDSAIDAIEPVPNERNPTPNTVPPPQPRPATNPTTKPLNSTQLHEFIAEPILLLEEIFRQAGLNLWSPAFCRHRQYSHVRFRIIDASKRIFVAPGLRLSDVFFMPPKFFASQAMDIGFEWHNFSQTIKQISLPEPIFGYVLGLVRAVETRETWTAPALQLSEFSHRFWLDEVPLLLPKNAGASNRWATLLKLVSRPNRRHPVVVDGAALRITEHWLPVYSEAHERLATGLVRDGVTFATSLVHDPDTAWAVPDFVTGHHDTWRRIKVPTKR